MSSIYKQLGIYRIRNTINGKCYIGKTGMNFGDRWDSHRSLLNNGKHDNPHLQSAWNKYGSKNFVFEVIEVVTDTGKLNELEIYYIKEYKDIGLSYNIHDGGDGGVNLGKSLSEETKRKIGEKNRVNNLGRKASLETRSKMSKSQIARYEAWTDEDRVAFGQKMSKVASGYHWSEESRKKFSERQKTNPNGAKFTPADILAIRDKWESGMKAKDLAAEYSTSPGYISSIVHRRRWADI